jgi:hypothetical protein
MIFEKIYTKLDNNLNICAISSYKIIMSKFINKYIEINELNYSDKKKLYDDAIIYSKYYLYYKTQKCVYSEEIMETIYNVEYFFN